MSYTRLWLILLWIWAHLKYECRDLRAAFSDRFYRVHPSLEGNLVRLSARPSLASPWTEQIKEDRRQSDTYMDKNNLTPMLIRTHPGLRWSCYRRKWEWDKLKGEYSFSSYRPSLSLLLSLSLHVYHCFCVWYCLSLFLSVCLCVCLCFCQSHLLSVSISVAVGISVCLCFFVSFFVSFFLSFFLSFSHFCPHSSPHQHTSLCLIPWVYFPYLISANSS